MSKLLAACLLLAGAFAVSLAYADDDQKQAASEGAASSAAEEQTGEKKLTDGEAEKRDKQAAENPEKIDWSKVDWRKRLTRMQYYILREAGTERAFQNKFWNYFKPGQYRCAGCGLPLFESDAKFESDCGWPSFDKTIAKDAITEHVDYKIGYARTEIRCRRCQSHLGHVFNDGPTDTGLRYCLNSAAMKFMNTKQLAAEKEKTKSATKDAVGDESKADAKESATAKADKPEAKKK